MDIWCPSAHLARESWIMNEWVHWTLSTAKFDPGDSIDSLRQKQQAQESYATRQQLIRTTFDDRLTSVHSRVRFLKITLEFRFYSFSVNLKYQIDFRVSTETLRIATKRRGGGGGEEGSLTNKKKSTSKIFESSSLSNKKGSLNKKKKRKKLLKIFEF